MKYEVRISDLGIADDDETFWGETPEEVVQQVVEYLRSQHKLNLPDAETILANVDDTVRIMPVGSAVGNRPEGSSGVTIITTEVQEDQATTTIVNRLRELLNSHPND